MTRSICDPLEQKCLKWALEVADGQVLWPWVFWKVVPGRWSGARWVTERMCI